MVQDEIEQKYLSELYTVYTDIETKILAKQKRVLEKSESLVLYTRNQFLRELQRMMNEDEALTLKYQMIDTAKLFSHNLNFINLEWDHFLKYLEKLHVNNFIAEEPVFNRSRTIKKFLKPKMNMAARKSNKYVSSGRESVASDFFKNFNF